MKKIMLLGGSSQQVIAIETAKRLGYKTVLCDFLCDNPGKTLADEFYLVSTTDKEEVLKVAIKEKVDGIISYASDPAAPTAAYVAENLRLPGNPYKAIDVLCNKDKFRKFLEENNFYTPKFLDCSNKKEALNRADSLTYPLIVKPVDSSGSKGITVVETKSDLEKAIDFAFTFSDKKRIIIEEFVEKKHPYLIGGDIFVIDGNISVWGLMNCHRDNRVNNLVPIGKSYPLLLDESDVLHIKRTLNDLVQKLGFMNGGMNIELVLDKNNHVILIDIGPRSGGNMIPQLMGDIFNVDIVDASIKTAMGEKVVLENITSESFYATYNLHSCESGILREIQFSNELKSNIYRMNNYCHTGDKVEAFDNASKCLGIVFMKFDSFDQILYTMNNHKNLFRAVLEV